MKIAHTPKTIAWFIVGSSMLLAIRPLGIAAEDISGVTALSSRVSEKYIRTKLPDGSFQAEFYAFGEGGAWGGQLSDATFDNLKFVDIARAIAGPLASRNYLPAKDPAKTKLLIMVYWGTTAVPDRPEEDPMYPIISQLLQPSDTDPNAIAYGLQLLALENRQRDLRNLRNAAILGYDSTGLIATDYGKYLTHTALGAETRDEVAEIEENRYFVVVMAYDFQLMWKEKKHSLLWETRFSVGERHNQFDKALPVMAQFASKYFGQDSRGLLRTRVPEGRVDVGDVKSLGTVPEK
jgi:hypothetical protein